METAMIYGKMAAVLADMEHIGKDRKNQQQNYQFRGIDDVYNSLHPVLAKHKVFVVPEVVSEPRIEVLKSKNGGDLIHVFVTMKYTWYAEDGSNVSCVVIGQGMDSGDKSANKAMAAANKYAILQSLSIPTDEPKDSENDSPEPQARKPVAKPTTPPPAKTAPPATKAGPKTRFAQVVENAVKAQHNGWVISPVDIEVIRKQVFEAGYRTMDAACDIAVKSRYSLIKDADDIVKGVMIVLDQTADAQEAEAVGALG